MYIPNPIPEGDWFCASCAAERVQESQQKASQAAGGKRRSGRGASHAASQIGFTPSAISNYSGRQLGESRDCGSSLSVTTHVNPGQGSSGRDYSAPKRQKLAPVFKVLEEVQAKWKRTATWFDGYVAAVNMDETKICSYHIMYTDGDEDMHVLPNNVRCRNSKAVNA